MAIDEIRRAFPRSLLAGCSSDTVIETGRIDDALVAVSVARFAHSRLAAVRMSADGDDAEGGRRMARQLAAHDGLVAVLALADGLLVNGSELVRGLVDGLPPGVVLTGGMAADGTRFERTWVIADGALCGGAATAIGFYGERLRVHSASRGGSIGFGPRRRVTRAQGNVVFELDGRPALALYEQYLGRYASALPASAAHFPLSVYRASDDETAVIRYVLGIDRVRQSITFAGDVPRGSVVQLSRAGRGELLRAAEQVAHEFDAGVASPDEGGAVLNIVVSCIGRRVVLGEQTDAEIEPVTQFLPPGTAQIGFYSYGEISGSARAPCDMHNMTLTLTTNRETGATPPRPPSTRRCCTSCAGCGSIRRNRPWHLTSGASSSAASIGPTTRPTNWSTWSRTRSASSPTNWSAASRRCRRRSASPGSAAGATTSRAA
jgi:hypothetical protein